MQLVEIETVFCQRTLFTQRLSCIANLPAEVDKIHVERVRLSHGNDGRQQLVRFFRATILWNQTEAFRYAQDVRIHREHFPSARKSKRNTRCFDADPFVLTE